MMRGPETTAMAVRNPEGEIVIEKFPTESVVRGKFFKLPLVRGIVGYIDSMKFGSKCLMRSAEIAGLDDAEAELEQEKHEKRLEKAKKHPKRAEKLQKKQEKEDAKRAALVAKAEEKLSAAEAQKAELESKLENLADGDCAKERQAIERDIRCAENKIEDAKKEIKNPTTSALMVLITTISMVFGMAIAIGLFFVLPTFLYGVAAKHIGFL